MIHRGTYDGTIYHNPVNKFCIISVKTADKEVPQEARSTRRYQPALRVDLQGAKEQRRVCGGSHRGKICNRRKSGDCFIKDSIIVIIKRQDYQLPKRITSL